MRARVLLLALVVTMFGAACAGDGEAPETQGGGEIEIAAVWSGNEQQRFESVLEAFTQQSGTQVTFTSTGDEIATVLRTKIEGNDAPDLAVLPQPGLMRDLVEQGALQPVDDVVGDAVTSDFAADWKQLATVDGKLYGVFFKGANKSTIWYSTDAFTKAGVEPPKTFDELTQTARTLKAAGVTPWSIGGGDAWTLTDWFENIYVRSAGPAKYDQLAEHTIPWTDPSVVDALRRMGSVMSDRTMLRGDPVQTSFVDSVDAVFRDPPDAAMVFEGDFVPGVATVEVKEGKYGVFSFPPIGDSGEIVVGGGDVAVMMTDSPDARALLEFLATAEAAEIWAKEGGFASPNKSVDASAYPDDITRLTATALANARTFRFDLSDLTPTAFGGTPGRGMWSILQDFVRDPSDPAATAKRLEDAAAAAYAAPAASP